VRRVMRRAGLLVGLVGLAMVGVVATAAPAAAHGAGGLGPRNYRTEILSVRPRVPGLTIRPIDLGDRLEVTNDSGEEVLILGYQDEPYLRVGPAGVFENEKSPAVYANRSRNLPNAPAPPGFDAKATPVWQRVSGGTTVQWHDHRAHWMGTQEPEFVQASPGRRHVVQDFDITMRRGGTTIVAHGQVLWIPGPSPWPWLALALGLAAVVVLLGRTAGWRWVLVAALAVLVVVEAVHVGGTWAASTRPTGARLSAAVYSFAGILLGAVAAVALARRRDPYDMSPLALVAAVVLTVVGVSDIATLSHSQLPTTLSGTSARLVVATVIGVGVGAVVTAAWRLRRPEPAVATTGDPPPS